VTALLEYLNLEATKSIYLQSSNLWKFIYLFIYLKLYSAHNYIQKYRHDFVLVLTVLLAIKRKMLSNIFEHT